MLRLTGNAWFRPSPVGALLPFPVAWQAWLAFLGVIVLIAASVRLDDETGWLVRIGALGLYFGFGYFNCDPDA